MSSSFLVHPVTLKPLATIAIAASLSLVPVNAIASVSTAGGALTVKAPVAADDGVCVYVLDADGAAGANPVTFDGNGTNIDGTATLALSTNSFVACFVKDNGQWRRVNPARAFSSVPLAPLYRVAEAAGGSTVAGANTQVIFNDAGSLAGNAGLVFDKTTGLVSATAAAFGTGSKAATGDLRLVSAGTIVQRNSANTADVPVIGGVADNIAVGSAAGPGFVALRASGQVYSQIAGNDRFVVDATGPYLPDAIPLRVGLTNVAGTGDCRFRSAFNVKARNNANTANTCLLDFASDGAFLGSTTGGTEAVATLTLVSNGNVNLSLSGNVQTSSPIIGFATGSSPYGVHGFVVKAFPADANYTVLASEYALNHLKFNQGSWTAGRNVVFPLPATDAASYYKWIWNNSTFTITVTNGGASTKNLITGNAALFLFHPGGVNQISTALAP